MIGKDGLGARQREIWDRIAPFWAEHRGAADPVIQWTPHRPDVAVAAARVLELGCGDGRQAVELAAEGATVLATDASPVFINLAAERAARRSTDLGGRFSTAVIDATDSASISTINGPFDLIVADMVLMNLVDLVPLARALPRLLAREGRFTATVLHPCFPSPFFVDVDHEGRPTGAVSRLVGAGQRIAAHLPERAVAAASVVVRPLLARTRPYLAETARRVAVPGQPEPHYNIHRPVGILLQPFFDEGLALHGLSEGTSQGRTDPGLLWFDLRHTGGR